MRVGLFDHMQKHDHRSRSYVDLYKSHLEVLEIADQAGMDFYFVPEHYFDRGFCECPTPGTFLGAASQRTKKILLSPLVYVLPLWSPETLVSQIKSIANQAGADTFLGEFTCGELTQKQALNSPRLFTEQVMPELKKFNVDGLNFPKADA